MDTDHLTGQPYCVDVKLTDRGYSSGGSLWDSFADQEQDLASLRFHWETGSWH